LARVRASSSPFSSGRPRARGLRAVPIVRRGSIGGGGRRRVSAKRLSHLDCISGYSCDLDSKEEEGTCSEKHIRLMLIATGRRRNWRVAVIAAGRRGCQTICNPDDRRPALTCLNQIRKAELTGIKQYAAKKHVKILFSVANNDANQQVAADPELHLAARHRRDRDRARTAIKSSRRSVRQNRAGIPFATIDRAPGKGRKRSSRR